MDCEKIIGDLESLWFFSNVFSSPSPPTNCRDEKPTQEILPNAPQSKQPISPIPHTIQVQASGDEDEIQVSEELESNVKNEELSDTIIEVIETPELVKEEERSSRVERRNHKPSSKARGKDQIMHEFNQFMGFAYIGSNLEDIELDGGLVPMIHRFEGSRRQYLRRKMPPFNDGMAMKEHIKTWAHAVACTVK